MADGEGKGVKDEIEVSSVNGQKVNTGLGTDLGCVWVKIMRAEAGEGGRARACRAWRPHYRQHRKVNEEVPTEDLHDLQV